MISLSALLSTSKANVQKDKLLPHEKANVVLDILRFQK